MSQKYERFGKYILLEKLAMGGMAEVFLARAQGAGGIGKFVAIKRILPQFTENPDFRRMFQEEAKIAINLSHGNIVSIYEFGMDKSQLFLVMDYVEGRNLRQILNKMKGTNSQFSSEQIIYMVKDVAGGLDHAHRSLNGATGKPLNITHRDISPQNIMVSFEGEVRIVDFGIAKAETAMEQTKTGTLKGKFGYMSPEQAEGQTDLDLRTDIFSLGIVLWELLANDRLFTASNEINTLRKIRECQIPSLRKINPNIDPELERICMKSLTRDRNLRYQTSAALHRDLNRFLNRHYPDFSPHDFSVFIKTQYADEILETRKRLIEYAKIPVQLDNEDRTLVTNDDKSRVTITRTATESGRQSTQTETSKDLDVAETKTDTDYTPLPIKLNRGPSPKVLSDEALQRSLYGMQDSESTAVHQTAIRLPQVAPGSIGSNDVHVGSEPKQQDVMVRNSKMNGNPSNLVMSMLLFAGILIATYTLLVRSFPEETCTLTGAMETMAPALSGLHDRASCYKSTSLEENQNPNIEAPACTPGDPNCQINSSKAIDPTVVAPGFDPNSANPSQPGAVVRPNATNNATNSALMISLTINSEPSGGEILIDGEPTGQVTPANVRVPSTRPFVVGIRKSDYETRVLKTSYRKIGRGTLNINLIPGNNALLTIDVKPPRNAQLFVNGEYWKGEILPIINQKFPADKDIVLEARNPVTGMWDRTVVRLRQGEKREVVLRLKRKPDKKFPASVK